MVEQSHEQGGRAGSFRIHRFNIYSSIGIDPERTRFEFYQLRFRDDVDCSLGRCSKYAAEEHA